MRLQFSLALSILTFSGFAQGHFKTDTLLENILRTDTSAILQKMIVDPVSIDPDYRDEDKPGCGELAFVYELLFHATPGLFNFYPASTVKTAPGFTLIGKTESIG